MPTKKRAMPAFLVNKIDSDVYERWLGRKAATHARRDQRRWEENWTSGAQYRDRIHAAVVASGGKDYYTGEDLDWTLVSKYNNEESKAGRHKYKATFALLPTVDHICADDPRTHFCICAWRTNDSKHDLSAQDFVDLCRKVVAHDGTRKDRDA